MWFLNSFRFTQTYSFKLRGMPCDCCLLGVHLRFVLHLTFCNNNLSSDVYFDDVSMRYLLLLPLCGDVPVLYHRAPSLSLFKILTISKKGINKPNTIFFFLKNNPILIDVTAPQVACLGPLNLLLIGPWLEFDHQVYLILTPSLVGG